MMENFTGVRYGVQRTMDDTVIPRLRPKNYLRAGDIRGMRKRARITLIFSIKTHRRYVTPPQGLREKRAFANRGWEIVKVLWWRYLGNVTYRRAREITASYLDQIYRMIHSERKPIVAIRATLVDWETGKPIPPRTLRDPWYYTTAFGEYKLDAFRLRSWGISVDAPTIQYERRFNAGDDLRENVVVREGSATLLELKTDLDVDNAINKAVYQTIAELPSLLRKAALFLAPDVKTPIPILLQRYSFTMRSANYRSRIKLWLDDMADDEKFLASMRRTTGMNNLVRAIKFWMLKDLIQRV